MNQLRNNRDYGIGLPWKHIWAHSIRMHCARLLLNFGHLDRWAKNRCISRERGKASTWSGPQTVYIFILCIFFTANMKLQSWILQDNLQHDCCQSRRQKRSPFPVGTERREVRFGFLSGLHIRFNWCAGGQRAAKILEKCTVPAVAWTFICIRVQMDHLTRESWHSHTSRSICKDSGRCVTPHGYSSSRGLLLWFAKQL